VLSLLLDASATIGLSDREGCTALHIAAQEGHAHVVKELIARRALIDQRDAVGFTPLHWACFCERESVAALLIVSGADPLLVAPVCAGRPQLCACPDGMHRCCCLAEWFHGDRLACRRRRRRADGRASR
jgi:ankyrin repeat protein